MSPIGESDYPITTAGQSTNPAAAQSLQNQYDQTDFRSVPWLARPARTDLSSINNLKGST